MWRVVKQAAQRGSVRIVTAGGSVRQRLQMVVEAAADDLAMSAIVTSNSIGWSMVPGGGGGDFLATTSCNFIASTNSTVSSSSHHDSITTPRSDRRPRHLSLIRLTPLEHRIPLKLLGESQGHVVTLELTSGQVYRGKLLEAEDNMNVQLKDITVTARDGRVSHLDQVYIRGSHECADVPVAGSAWSRCRHGERTGDGQQGEDAAAERRRQELDLSLYRNRGARSNKCHPRSLETRRRRIGHKLVEIEFQFQDECRMHIIMLFLTGKGVCIPDANTFVILHATYRNLLSSISPASIPPSFRNTPRYTTSMPERRILLVGRRDAEVLQFLESLTGSLPAHHPTSASHAGLTHSLPLKTQYYESTIPIWIDEIADPAAEWAAAYASKEAREVRQALGAIVYVFRRPTTAAELTATVRGDLAGIGSVVDACGGRYGWDGVCLAVAMPVRGVVADSDDTAGDGTEVRKTAEEWEDEVREFGFEFIEFEAKGRNDYGEPTGMERVKEALEANDWTAGPSLDLDALEELDDDDLAELAGESAVDGDGNVRNGLKLEADEMEREMFGLHQAILEAAGDQDDDEEDDEELQLEQLEAAMQRLQTVKDMVSELPEDQKRAFAAKAVAEVMKTL
ncbi:Small nuclear ribonucleoprotein [Drechslerella dactyloides]|uniref:Small nuclear ribonucleoprotein n=1 Tax=Drechslerella dactyloides TaxID=74499 RepID=A0AAD6J002_DREDA|nr:Small nuclear ribonucleoprotein [Drechslerella dactyloides]